MQRKAASALLAVAIAAACLYLPWLGARDLWNPNEPTYGRAVVEMHDRGDLLIPTVNGRIFDEKPILYFWMALASSTITGVSETTLRLPSAVCGIIFAVLVFLLTQPYTTQRRAVMASAITATSYVVWWSARSINMDLLVATTTLAAIVAITRTVDHDLDASTGWTLAGIATGLGFLAKGPVAILLPAFAILPYLAFSGRLSALRNPTVQIGAAIALAVTLPWFVMLWARGEIDFLTEALIRQNVSRVIDPWDHQKPWWYFLQVMWIDWLPWSLLLPLSIGGATRAGPERRLERLAWCWLIVTIAFFSLSPSKRSPYILPAAPAMAILVSGVLDRWAQGTLDTRRALLARLWHVLWGAAFVGLAVAVAGRPELAQEAWTSAGQRLVTVAAVAGVLVLIVSIAGRRLRELAPVAVLAALAAIYTVASSSVLPAANATKSHRAFCRSINAIVEPGEPLVTLADWEFRASFSYYTDRNVPVIRSIEQFHRYWRTEDRRVCAVIERGRLEDARPVLGDTEPLARGAFGSNAAWLYCNQGPPVAFAELLEEEEESGDRRPV